MAVLRFARLGTGRGDCRRALWFALICTVCASLSTSWSAEASVPIVGGYIADWHGRKTVEKMPLGTYTHLFHAFLTADVEGRPILKEGKGPNKWLPELGHKAGCEVILSLGGGGYEGFGEICGDEVRRRRFVAGVVGVVGGFGYDGIDVDWEHPRNAEEGAQWATLVKELRGALDELAAARKRGTRYRLTAAVYSSDWGAKWIDAKTVNAHLDWLNVMTYDYAGPWGGVVGAHAALTTKADTGLSVANGMKYWQRKRGIAKDKLLVGLPFYGYLFHDSAFGDELANGHGRKVEALSWVAMSKRLEGEGWERRYAVGRDALLVSNTVAGIAGGIDDAAVMKVKTKWALDQGYGGVFVWELGQEIDPEKAVTPLSDAIRMTVRAAGRKKSSLPD